jgi:hypothetical protein
MKALETTYKINGVTRVVRTEPTGNEAKTARAHMVACKAALTELRQAANAEQIAAIEADMSSGTRSAKSRKIQADNLKRLKGSTPKVVAHDWPSIVRPVPALLPLSHGFNLEDYREAEPVAEAAPVVEITRSGIPADPFDFLADLLANVGC